KFDARFHQPLTDTTTAEVRIDGHLRQLERIALVRDHRDGAGNVRAGQCEKDLSTDIDHRFLWMVEDVVIVFFNAVRFSDPLDVEVREFLCVRGIELYDRDGHTKQL